MDESDDRLDNETLDVEMTVEGMFLFIPFTLAVILGVGMFGAGTFFHTWKVIFIMPPLWAFAAVVVKRDRNALRVLNVWLRLSRLLYSAYRHGGFSFDPPQALASQPYLTFANAAR